MGPPKLPPGFHWRTIGLFESVKVNPRALKNSLRLNTKALPCTWLVPDLVTQLITPFEVRPYSAEYDELCTLNSSMPSTLTPFMAGSLRRSLLDSAPSSCSLWPSSSPPPMRGLLAGPITPGVRMTKAKLLLRPPPMNNG